MESKQNKFLLSVTCLITLFYVLQLFHTYITYAILCITSFETLNLLGTTVI